MCSRFSQPYRVNLQYRWDKIRNPKNLQAELLPQYNVAPTDEAVVMVEENGEWVMDKMVFGMVPHWAKDVKMGLNCINARSESVFEKPSFREPIRKRRCIVPADGYFEWQREGKLKLPHRFVPAQGELFALAGVWDEWKSPNGQTLRSFAILTREPNALAASIHDRMPVILKPADEAKWLSPAVTAPEELLPLFEAFPAEQMKSYRVTPAMNRSGYKEADSIEPLKP